MDTDTAAPRTLTIAEAAEATGISKKGIRNRVDRQTLDHVLRGWAEADTDELAHPCGPARGRR